MNSTKRWSLNFTYSIPVFDRAVCVCKIAKSAFKSIFLSLHHDHRHLHHHRYTQIHEIECTEMRFSLMGVCECVPVLYGCLSKQNCAKRKKQRQKLHFEGRSIVKFKFNRTRCKYCHHTYHEIKSHQIGRTLCERA